MLQTLVFNNICNISIKTFIVIKRKRLENINLRIRRERESLTIKFPKNYFDDNHIILYLSLKFRTMMLKQVFALALLSHSVLGRWTDIERQLVDGADQGTGDEWQYCEDKCNETCIPCEVHNVCSENEIKCGEGPTRKSPEGFELHLCPKDEICVDDSCQCRCFFTLINT